MEVTELDKGILQMVQGKARLETNNFFSAITKVTKLIKMARTTNKKLCQKVFYSIVYRLGNLF